MARLIEGLRRLMRRPPADWMGADPALDAAARAAPAELDNRHEIVALPGVAAHETIRLRALAARGHRVFLVSPQTASGERPYELTETAPRLFDVALAAAQFEGMDALRRDRALGATVCVARDPAWLALAQRLEAELDWPTAPSGLEPFASAFPLLSILIVTYGNRELNRLCLDSVLARTEWPHREVLVVDNGSTDGTPELLTGLASRHPEIRPILFAENRGYPAAVNAALAQARGRHLVLLNNDTVVTRGWATALSRHLVRNPGLGLVGPVTNAIANEARIDTAYGGLDELPNWARRFTSEHDGETFAIPTLAFFCTALRRDVYEQVGPLDERFGLGMFEDGDYNRRVRAAGLDIRCASDAFVHHWQMASFRRLGKKQYLRLFEENRRKFEEKWGPSGS